MQMEQALDAIVDRSVVLDDPVEVFGQEAARRSGFPAGPRAVPVSRQMS